MTAPRIGDRFTSAAGRPVTVTGYLGTGGQADCYLGVAEGIPGEIVVKEFKPCATTPESRARTRILAAWDLQSTHKGLCGPFDYFETSHSLGHLSRRCHGIKLSELFEAETFQSWPYSLHDGLTIGIQLSHQVAILHKSHFAHGDLNWSNILVERTGSAYLVRLIDFDNFNHPGTPPPGFLGEDNSMAPELYRAKVFGESCLPKVSADCFALAAVLHYLLLLKFPNSGVNPLVDDDMLRAKSRWLHDPHGPHQAFFEPVQGNPNAILCFELVNLFRRAISADAPNRPTALNWREALTEIGKEGVHVCSQCNQAFCLEVTKTLCPHCGGRFPTIVLRANTGAAVRVCRGAQVIGRSELRANERVSSQHCILRKIGPEVSIEAHPRALNGTFKLVGGNWISLKPGQRVLVEPGDRFCLANRHCELAVVAA